MDKSSTATLNIRMDKELKESFDDVAHSIGMSSATAFNVFARQFVAHRGFPFPVTEPVPTEREFAEEMDRIYYDMKAGDLSAHELQEG